MLLKTNSVVWQRGVYVISNETLMDGLWVFIDRSIEAQRVPSDLPAASIAGNNQSWRPENIWPLQI